MALTIMFVAAQSAEAATYSFATVAGATAGGQPVNVNVTLSLNPVNDTLTVQILNLETEPNFVVDFQMVSSLQITMTNLNTATTAPSVTSYSFSGITIDKTTKAAAPASPQPSNSWAFPTAGAYSLGSGILTFCANCPNGGNKDLVVGGPDASGNYPDVNASVAGAAHQPYLLGSGLTYTTGALAGLNSTPTWVLSVPQITTNTAITAVTIGFGTAWGTDATTAGQTTFAPEVAPAALVLLGLGGIGLAQWRRRRRNGRFW